MLTGRLLLSYAFGVLMAKIYVMKGLPASGKSYHAKELVKAGAKRVSKDLLRQMLDFGVYTSENERLINLVKGSVIRTLVMYDYDVVVDDTNLNPDHLEDLYLAASMTGSDIEVIDLTSVAVDLCIERDVIRGNKSVGEVAIREMYDKYIKPAE